MNRRLRVFGRLNILAMLCAMPLAASTSRIYVTNHAGTTIQVIDPATNKVVQEIKDIEAPEGVSFSPDGSRVYLTQIPEDVLTVLDRKSGKLIKKVPLSGIANDVIATKDGKLILVCIHTSTGWLDVIDASSLEKVKSIPSSKGLHDIVLTPDNKFAIASSEGGKTIAVFDLTSQTLAWEMEFDMGTQVMAVEPNPDGSAHRIFLTLNRLRGFAVVDFATRKEIQRITFPDDEPTLVPSGSPSHGLGMAPDGKTLWVGSRTYDCVFVYSLPDLKLMGRVHLPQVVPPGHEALSGAPFWVVFTGDSKFAYVSSAADRSVSAIDVKTLKMITRIQVGEEPGRMTTLVLP